MSTDTTVAEEIQTTVTIPNEWKVVILNDDVTPMELVIFILAKIFNKSEALAKDIMLQVHHEGAAVAGTYSHEIADQKRSEAIALARANKSPLVIKIEEDL